MCEYVSNDFKWSGRIDSETDESAFRIHQVIKPINLDEINEVEKPFIALIGFCSDEGVKRNKGRVGASKAPNNIRKYLSSIPFYFENLKLFDAGNIYIENEDLEEAQKILGEKVAKIKKLGGFPIVIGGGHETAYGSYLGINDLKPAIINFDAHFDNRPYDEGVSSGTMFAQIYEELKDDYRYLCLGIQKSGNTKQLFERNKKFGGDYLLAEDFYKKSEIVRNKIKEFIKDSEFVYTTLCMDVFAESVAFGVSAPTSFGIMPQQFAKAVEVIIKSKKLCLFDITEVNPDLDINDMTSRLAANIIFQVISKIDEWGYI